VETAIGVLTENYGERFRKYYSYQGGLRGVCMRCFVARERTGFFLEPSSRPFLAKWDDWSSELKLPPNTQRALRARFRRFRQRNLVPPDSRGRLSLG